jgi:hypothetical protein
MMEEMVLWNILAFSELHFITTQSTILLVVTTVKPSNPECVYLRSQSFEILFVLSFQCKKGIFIYHYGFWFAKLPEYRNYYQLQFHTYSDFWNVLCIVLYWLFVHGKWYKDSTSNFLQCLLKRCPQFPSTLGQILVFLMLQSKKGTIWDAILLQFNGSKRTAFFSMFTVGF